MTIIFVLLAAFGTLITAWVGHNPNMWCDVAVLMWYLLPLRDNQPLIGKGWSIKLYGRSFRV